MSAFNTSQWPVATLAQTVDQLRRLHVRAWRPMNWLRPYTYSGTRLLWSGDDWQYQAGPWSNWHGHVPLDVIVPTANDMGVSTYINLPYALDDTAIQQAVEYVAANHHGAWWITLGNEVWNTADAYKHQLALYGGWPGYAARIRRLADIVAGRGRVVLEAQCRNPDTARYLLQTERLGDVVQAVAIAPYVGRMRLTGSESADWLLQTARDDLYQPSSRGISAVTGIVAHAELAARYGIELLGYEAGHHYIGASAALDSLLQDGRMRRLYDELHVFWCLVDGGPLFWYRLFEPPTAAGRQRTEHWGWFESGAPVRALIV